MGIAQKTVPYHTSVARTSSELGEMEKSIKNLVKLKRIHILTSQLD